MAISFTEELRVAAGDQWERVINHKFTTELAKGDIDKCGKSLEIYTFMNFAHHNM